MATASATRSDPSGDGDRQGDPPSYADIRRATVVGRGSRVRFIVRVDGSLPASGPPEGVDMTASFHFRTRGGREHQIYAIGSFRTRGGREHQIYAIGSHSGWKADLDNSGEFPGRFTVDGDSLVFELQWPRVDGPARLKWLAQTSWTRAPEGPLDDTEFAFDQVPEYEKASYPD